MASSVAQNSRQQFGNYYSGRFPAVAHIKFFVAASKFSHDHLNKILTCNTETLFYKIINWRAQKSVSQDTWVLMAIISIRKNTTDIKWRHRGKSRHIYTGLKLKDFPQITSHCFFKTIAYHHTFLRCTLCVCNLKHTVSRISRQLY